MSDNRPRHTLRGAFAALAVCAALVAVPAAAGAATITVNTTADSAPAIGECGGAAGDCSLRQAIDVANAAGGANTIVVPGGTYDLTIAPGGEDGNESGDLDVADEALTIEGAGARHTVIDARPIEDRVLRVGVGDALSLAGLTITGGHAEKDGAGIEAAYGVALSLEGVAVTDNVAFGDSTGGGIAAGGGSLRIVDSTLSGNRNSGDGGAIEAGNEELTIEDSTIADNVVDTSLDPSEPRIGAYGGAMEAWFDVLVMRNVTITGNEVIDGNGGGAGEGPAVYGGLFRPGSEVVDTIIADNTGTEVDEPHQCHEPLVSAGHNLETAAPEGEAPCFESASDLVGDPLLSALADNGGETDTAAIAADSPAVDADDAGLCPPTDQRGISRPQGSGCDIGAYELVPAAAPAIPRTAPVVPDAPPVAPGSPTTSAAARVLPSWFGIKKARRDIARGTLKLGVKFNVAGVVTITGPGIKPVSRPIAAGLRYVPLVAAGAAEAKLARGGRARVKVEVSFETAADTYAKRHVVAFRHTT